MYEPVDLDVQGQDEDEPPPRPQRVKVTLATVVALVTGLVAGGAGWNAFADWRADVAARGETLLQAVVLEANQGANTGAGDRVTLSANVRLFNYGDHTVNINGLTTEGWPAVNSRQREAEVEPGRHRDVMQAVQLDCATDQDTPTMVKAAVTTADGTERQVDIPLARGILIAENRQWLCPSGSSGEPPIWGGVMSTFASASDTLPSTIMVDTPSDTVTVTDLQWSTSAFTIEAAGLPVEVEFGQSQTIDVVWRVAECGAAANFESNMPLTLVASLADGRTGEIDVSYGQVLASLARLAERNCPSP